LGFRNAYVFDISQTDGVDLPAMREVSGDPGENIDRLLLSHSSTARASACLYREHRARAWHELRRTHRHLPGQSKAETFATLVHETAHELLHKSERRTATTKTVRETEAEAVAFVVGKAVGLVNDEPPVPRTSSFTTATPRAGRIAWKSFSRPPASSLPHWSRPHREEDARCRTGAEVAA
jgi:hypothetical protein